MQVRPPIGARRPVVDVPVEHEFSIGDVVPSSNGVWLTFWSSSPTVVDGLTGSVPRVFRRHVPSGATHLVGAFPSTARTPVWITDGGLVLVSFLGGSGTQLFAWSRPGTEPVQLTVGPSGEAPTGPLTPLSLTNTVHATADGTRVAFTSLASNLAGARASGPSRLYVATLPPAYPNGDAVVPRDGRLCVAAVGASPGQFVALNVTPVLAGVPGFGTMHSSDDPAGATSSVNFGPGTVDPNVAFAEVGADGDVCYTNSEHGPVHVVIDELVVGTVGSFTPPTAAGSDRIVDTRATTQVPASGTRCFGANGSAGDFTAVNVTPVNASTAGFGVLHSSDEPAGATSNVNFEAGSVDPNVAFAKIGADGRLCFTNSEHGAVDVVVDQLVVSPTSTFSLPSPRGAERLLDTRTADSPTRPSATRCVDAVGASPGDWVVLNVTPVLAGVPGFGTMHSSDDPAGGTSTVNFGPGTVDPNVAIVEVGSDSRVCFTNSEHGAVHVVVDQLVTATADAFAAPTGDGARRLVDTRIGRG